MGSEIWSEIGCDGQGIVWNGIAGTEVVGEGSVGGEASIRVLAVVSATTIKELEEFIAKDVKNFHCSA